MAGTRVRLRDVAQKLDSRRRDSVSTEAATSTFRSGRFIVRLANAMPLSRNRVKRRVNGDFLKIRSTSLQGRALSVLQFGQASEDRSPQYHETQIQNLA